MSKNHKIVVVLTFLLFASFPVMILGGIDLTYESAVGTSTSAGHIMSQPQNKNMAMDFAMAIPGIVLIVFGYVGIFIMLFKVPAKEIIGYESSHESNQENTTNSSILTPVLSDKSTKISLPVWWLVKSKGIFSKI